jgi:DNA gyrase subunit A
VIALIRGSRTTQDAREGLMTRFALTERQAQAILDMRLQRLTGLERDKIEAEYAELQKLIAYYREVLANESMVLGIIKDELTEIKRKYADERRTEIVEAADDILLEDLIERHECVITITHSGYIKRLPADTYSAQNRGGKGIIGMSTKDEDFIEKVMVVGSHSYLMMFTSTGKVYLRKAYMIPEASRTAKGSNIVNILELEAGEKITAIISLADFENSDEKYLTMVTRKGVIKRSILSEYEFHRKGGKIAIGLDEGDELVSVLLTEGQSDIIIASADGCAVRFTEKGARTMGRTARGVRGITLRGDDYVAGVIAIEEDKKLLTITQNGFGKRTEFDEFRLMKNRGGMGVVCHNVNERTGRIAGIAAVDGSEDMMIITDGGTIIRTPVEGVPTYSRSASGVIVMRLGEGQSCVSFTTLPHSEGEDEDAQAEEAEE